MLKNNDTLNDDKLYVEVSNGKIGNYLYESNLKKAYGKSISEDELKEQGYYRVISKLEDLVLDKNQKIVDSEVVYDSENDIVIEQPIIEEISVEEYKNNLINKVRTMFKTSIRRPKVKIEDLNIVVDGGKDDLNNYLSAKDLQLTIIRDAYDNDHEIQVDDWDKIIKAVRSKGFSFFKKKWEYIDKIKEISNDDSEGLTKLLEIEKNIDDEYVETVVTVNTENETNESDSETA